jgi:hypothetical protein
MSGTGVEMPTKETRLAIVDAWRNAFPKSPKVMLIGDTDGMRHAVERGCGWRADCLGDMGGFSKTWNHMDHMYRQQIKATGAEDAWKNAPVAFESCWDMRKWKESGWDIRHIFDYALDLHASYLNNKSAPIPDGTRPEVERFLRRMGYRLVVRRLEHDEKAAQGGTVSARLEWENVGVAPPYGRQQTALRLTDSRGRTVAATKNGAGIQGWLPGKTRTTHTLRVPADAPAGHYALSVGIVEPGTNKPSVRLAVAGRDADGWYPLSHVEISGKGSGQKR